jgi:membrane-associated phospholipid phosphatase
VLAHMYLATADAGIACWEAKYRINFWRPFTAIRRGDDDGNGETHPDLTWETFLNTPQHPEFPSGHSTNSGAMATVLMLAFGDSPGLPIVATSPTNTALVRTWKTFSEGVAEVINARIYSGFHFRRANEAGALLGYRIGKYVVEHSLTRQKQR